MVQNKKMYRFVILYMVVLISITAATISAKRTGSSASRHKRKVKSVEYQRWQLIVDGVECIWCAQEVGEYLKKLPAVYQVTFSGNPQAVEQGKLLLYVKPKESVPTVAQMNQLLSPHQFSVTRMIGRLKGQYISRIDYQQERELRLFKEKTTNQEYFVSTHVMSPRSILTTDWQPLKKNKLITISGTIWFDRDTNTSWLVPS